ncbi:MAG: prepilin-type N-terminal cleavage/methylation domain-containing protein, partial [Lactobacillales bacterium]|nr:prepilin-type N-terminal cleavage/methylation domain-containing protein [Lactobacillales bacterium]
MNQKNKKGFTLIELLAVIVILAIIALIAVPIVLNMIEDARKSAAVDSTYGYIKAVEYEIGLDELKNKNRFKDGKEDVENLDINVKGTK